MSTGAILERADPLVLAETYIDGRAMERLGLDSKPAPDTTLAACDRLELSADQFASFETTVAGVEAAKSPASALSSSSTVTAVRRSSSRARIASSRAWEI